MDGIQLFFPLTDGALQAIDDRLDEAETNDTGWDDWMVPLTAAQAGISSPPEFRRFRNDSAAAKYAANFDGTYQYASAAWVQDFQNIDFVLSVWIYPTNFTGTQTIIEKAGQFSLTLQNSARRPQFMLTTAGPSALTVGAANQLAAINRWYHIVCTFDAVAQNMAIFINGVLIAQQYKTGVMAKPNIATTVGGAGANYFIGRMDELLITSADPLVSTALRLYGDGSGYYTPAATVTATGNVWHFEENAGDAVADEKANASLTTGGGKGKWADGWVSTGSRGVFAHYFMPDVTQEMFFTSQSTHKWSPSALVADSNTLHPHIHLSIPSGYTVAGKSIVLGLEYIIIKVNGAIPATTTVITAKCALDGAGVAVDSHTLFELPLITVPVVDTSVSMMFWGRVYRAGDHADDNFEGPIILGEFDKHLLLRRIGSPVEYGP